MEDEGNMIDYQGISWDCMEDPGTSWNINGTSWNAIRYQERHKTSSKG